MKANKQHYIPQFYLKNFGDNEENLYVYDKNLKIIEKNPKKAKQLFYKNNLYTATVCREKTHVIEDGYSSIETQISKLIREIKDCDSLKFDELSQDKDFANLVKIIISIQFWRNPIHEELAKTKSEVLLELFDRFHVFNKDVIPFDKKDVKYLFKKKHKKSIFKFIQFCILPLLTFKFDGKLPEEFKILKVSEFGYERDLVCTDNPVCFEQINDEMEFSGYFHFPLTKELLITNDTGYDFDKIQNVIIEKSQEKVVGSSIELLNHLFFKND